MASIGTRSLARAQVVHPITALQTEYSLWARDLEADDWRLTTPRFSEENAGATIVELSADELTEVERMTAGIEIHGTRYPEANMAMLGKQRARSP